MVNMRNSQTDQIKQVKVGFSWTMFFFGFWVPLFRGDWRWLVVMLLLDIIGIWSYGTVSSIANIIMAFLYNKLYIEDLIKQGWYPADASAENALQSKGIAY